MKLNNFKTEVNEILGKVKKPITYTGNEVNSIHKELNENMIRFALAFPDIYEVGMSHIGTKILYGLLNKNEDLVYSKKEYEKIEKVYLELEHESQKEKTLVFIDEPIRIRRYDKNDYNKQLRKGKIDYVTREIINTAQGEITEKDILDYEKEQVMKFGDKKLVEEMQEFFDHKKNDEGYDIKSF